MSTLKIITKVENNKWVVEFSLLPGGDFPADIFLWENTGTGLGEYQTICTLTEYSRYKTYDPDVTVPVFGNRFLKHTSGVITADITVDPQDIRAKITSDVKVFKASYIAGESSTELVTI